MDDDDLTPRPFEGVVRRGHALEGRVVLLFERYAGDVEVGDVLRITTAAGTADARVVTIAWGSAFGHEDPPLTLVVEGPDTGRDYAGATLASATKG